MDAHSAPIHMLQVGALSLGVGGEMYALGVWELGLDLGFRGYIGVSGCRLSTCNMLQVGGFGLGFKE